MTNDLAVFDATDKILLYPVDRESLPVIASAARFPNVDIRALVSLESWGHIGECYRCASEEVEVSCDYESSLDICSPNSPTSSSAPSLTWYVPCSAWYGAPNLGVPKNACIFGVGKGAFCPVGQNKRRLASVGVCWQPPLSFTNHIE
jgi:hypothetical protein